MTEKKLKNTDKALHLEDKRRLQRAKAIDTKVTQRSKLTCPQCGYEKAEIMPTNACQWFYECEQCHTVLKPKQGDCCVFCSYGSVACPSIQINNRGCVNNEE